MIRITGSKLNMKSIGQKVNGSRAFDRAALRAAQRKLNMAKEELLQDFNEHPVTRELEDGVHAENYSRTLGGYGNLFSFMGFGQGDKPAEAVENFLKSFISLRPASRSSKNVKEYKVKIPSLQDFDFAKMPWESGNSWVRSIETGISGFSYYMHKAHEASRAGTGIQIDNKLRGKDSKSIKYMSELLNTFRKRLMRK